MVVPPNLGGQFRVPRLRLRLGRCHADYLRRCSRRTQIGNYRNLEPPIVGDQSESAQPAHMQPASMRANPL
jgi:hypothetical protein